MHILQTQIFCKQARLFYEETCFAKYHAVILWLYIKWHKITNRLSQVFLGQYIAQQRDVIMTGLAWAGNGEPGAEWLLNLHLSI